MRRATRIARLFAVTLLVMALGSVPHALSAPEDLLDGAYYTIATWPSGGRTFSDPGGAAVDAAGNVYIADTRNHVIKKLSSAGDVLAEWGGKGTGNGEFDEPAAVAVGTSGNVYVADTGNDRVQVLASDGSFVRTWGSFGTTTTGEFNAPQGIAVGASENVYVSDTGNDRIQKFTSAGAFTTTWGANGSGDGLFKLPRGIAVGPDGSVYVADVSNVRIQKFTSSGGYLTQWGPMPDGGGGYTSRYKRPYGVYATAAGVFVADAGRHVIEKCSTSGAVLATWGTDGVAGSGVGQFTRPEDVAVDTTGTVYVADTGNNRVAVMSGSGVWQGAWTSGGSGEGELQGPEDVSLDAAGSTYVADTDNNRVQRLDGDGEFVVAMGSQGSGAASLTAPSGVAVSATGTVYVADRGNNRIQTYDTSGTPLGSFGSLSGPRGVNVAPDGTIWVADSGNDAVVQYSAAGAAIGGFGTSGSGNGQLNDPRDVAVDASGTVYVCDTGNNRVQKFTSAGAYVAKWGSWGTADGRFRVPEKLALGPDGDVYVSDRGNDRVQRFTYDGEFRIAFGTAGAGSGEMHWPTGVAVDATNRVYVAERDNHRVQVLGYDDTPPTTTALGIPVGWTNAPVTVTLVATDDASGVEETYYRFSAAATPTVYAGPFTITAQGETQVRFWSVDRAGQVETETFEYVRIDSLGPTGTFMLDGGAPYTQSTTVTANSAMSDPRGMHQMRFDTGSGYSGWEPYAATSQTALPGEGTHTVTAQYSDILGNTTTKTATIQVDYTPPTSAASGIPTGWAMGPITVTLEASDTLSGVADTYYSVDGGAQTTYTATFDITAEGTSTVAFYSVDRAGNVEATQTATVRIDDTPPAGTMQLNGGAPYSASTTVTATSAVTDAHGMDAMRFDTGSGYGAWEPYATTKQLSLPGEGTRTVNAQYRDVPGNVATLTASILVDMTPPTSAASGIPASWAQGPVTVTLEASDTLSGVADTYYSVDGGAQTTYTVPFQVAAEGTSTVTFHSVDAAGNVEATETATVRIDDSPPTSAASGIPASWAQGPVTVTLEASDTLSGVADTYYSVDGGAQTTYTVPFDITDEGTSTVTFHSVDAAGNVEATQAATVRIDDSPPTSAASGIPASWAHGPVTVTLEASDTLSGVADTYYAIDGGAQTTYTVPFQVAAEGTSTVTFHSVDAAGNIEATQTATVRIDDSPPTSAASGISPGPVVGPVPVSLEASDTYSGVADTYYSIDGSATTTYTAPFDVTKEGTSTVRFYSVDEVGNVETTQTALVKIDNTLPHGTMQVNAGAQYSTSTELSVDSSVTGAVEMSATAGGVVGTWTPYSATMTVTAPGEGVTTVTAQYRDAAGNTLELVDTIIIDTIAPVTTSDAKAEYSGSATIKLTATDERSGVKATYYRLDGAAAWTEGTTIIVHTSGEHVLEFYSEDNAGNDETPQTFRFTNDTLVTRRGGANRYAVAVDASRGNFPDSEHVILATGMTYADALSASGLAGCLEAPILLTPQGSLPGYVEAEIKRLGATTVTIVGGPNSVAPAIEKRLRTGLGLTVERIGGKDRYAVSRAIAERVRAFGNDDGRVFIASGEVGADALSLSPIVYSAQAPLVLTAKNTVPSDTAVALRAGDTKTVVLAGGPNTVTSANAARMTALVGTPIKRLWGTDRYATGAAVARYGVASGISSYSYLGVANGADDKFADSLCGGPAVGRDGGVMTLTQADVLPSATRGVLASAKGTVVEAQVFGGPDSVSEAVVGQIRAIIE